MTTWLEFRVEDENCPHEIDVYDGCPLCRITELETNCAFFKSCALSGESPLPGSEPYPPENRK